MAGIYIHIPFCKSRCAYCGFFSSTAHGLRSEYVAAVINEASNRKDYLKGETVGSLYLGGGTPSQLSMAELAEIIAAVENHYRIDKNAERTIECNPDDISADYAHGIARLGFNRVSMGVQTFDDSRLKFIGRRHTAAQAANAVNLLRQAGVANISIDLMYGFPGETMDEWISDIDTALTLGVEHISAYGLMYEEGTRLMSLLEQGKVSQADDETYREMYETLVDKLSAHGYEHYEVSNFARPGFRSRHNSGYWTGMRYIGLGAAAHSYDGDSRQWNVSDIDEYIRNQSFECELLSPADKYNDTVMLRLRTAEGLDLVQLETTFGSEALAYCLANARRFISTGELTLAANRLVIPRHSIYISDYITTELMKV